MVRDRAGTEGHGSGPVVEPQVRTQSWDETLGGSRRHARNSQQDFASCHLWAASDGCRDHLASWCGSTVGFAPASHCEKQRRVVHAQQPQALVLQRNGSSLLVLYLPFVLVVYPEPILRFNAHVQSLADRMPVFVNEQLSTPGTVNFVRAIEGQLQSVLFSAQRSSAHSLILALGYVSTSKSGLVTFMASLYNSNSPIFTASLFLACMNLPCSPVIFLLLSSRIPS